MVYHNDVTIMDRNNTVQWKVPTLEGEPPTPREYHTLTAVSPRRALLFGGQSQLCWQDHAARSMHLAVNFNVGTVRAMQLAFRAHDSGGSVFVWMALTYSWTLTI